MFDSPGLSTFVHVCPSSRHGVSMFVHVGHGFLERARNMDNMDTLLHRVSMLSMFLPLPAKSILTGMWGDRNV